MKLYTLNNEFSICRINDLSKVSFDSEFVFFSKTDEEISLVCDTNSIPDNVIVADDGCKGFRIQGILDFSLVGILSKITAVLAENNIGIFAVSTYNTDYIFVKSENMDKAVDVLKCSGYEFE